MLLFAEILTGIHSEETLLSFAREEKLPSLNAADLVFTTVNSLIHFGSTKGLISS